MFLIPQISKISTGKGQGRIMCGDVGQERIEELDLIKKGANYGWNIFEGGMCYYNRTDLCESLLSHELPIYEYKHNVGKSVIGGKFYRGCISPRLDGWYIYGDYMNGYVIIL